MNDPRGHADAAMVLTHLAGRPATLRHGRLLCIDGPSGSGKTTLAGAVVGTAGGSVALVHMDDLYEGWSGLPDVGVQLATLLRPLAAGDAGHYRRYDWHRAGFAERHVVEPVDLLVVEGVGAGSAATAGLATVLVWVDASYARRRARGHERGDFGAHWEEWAAEERRHFAREQTRERADLVLTTG